MVYRNIQIKKLYTLKAFLSLPKKAWSSYHFSQLVGSRNNISVIDFSTTVRQLRLVFSLLLNLFSKQSKVWIHNLINASENSEIKSVKKQFPDWDSTLNETIVFLRTKRYPLLLPKPILIGLEIFEWRPGLLSNFSVLTKLNKINKKIMFKKLRRRPSQYYKKIPRSGLLKKLLRLTRYRKISRRKGMGAFCVKNRNLLKTLSSKIKVSKKKTNKNKLKLLSDKRHISLLTYRRSRFTVYKQTKKYQLKKRFGFKHYFSRLFNSVRSKRKRKIKSLRRKLRRLTAKARSFRKDKQLIRLQRFNALQKFKRSKVSDSFKKNADNSLKSKKQPKHTNLKLNKKLQKQTYKNKRKYKFKRVKKVKNIERYLASLYFYKKNLVNALRIQFTMLKHNLITEPDLLTNSEKNDLTKKKTRIKFPNYPLVFKHDRFFTAANKFRLRAKSLKRVKSNKNLKLLSHLNSFKRAKLKYRIEKKGFVKVNNIKRITLMSKKKVSKKKRAMKLLLLKRMKFLVKKRWKHQFFSLSSFKLFPKFVVPFNQFKNYFTSRFFFDFKKAIHRASRYPSRKWRPRFRKARTLYYKRKPSFEKKLKKLKLIRRSLRRLYKNKKKIKKYVSRVLKFKSNKNLNKNKKIIKNLKTKNLFLLKRLFNRIKTKKYKTNNRKLKLVLLAITSSKKKLNSKTKQFLLIILKKKKNTFKNIKKFIICLKKREPAKLKKTVISTKSQISKRKLYKKFKKFKYTKRYKNKKKNKLKRRQKLNKQKMLRNSLLSKLKRKTRYLKTLTRSKFKINRISRLKTREVFSYSRLKLLSLVFKWRLNLKLFVNNVKNLNKAKLLLTSNKSKYYLFKKLKKKLNLKLKLKLKLISLKSKKFVRIFKKRQKRLFVRPQRFNKNLTLRYSTSFIKRQKNLKLGKNINFKKLIFSNMLTLKSNSYIKTRLSNVKKYKSFKQYNFNSFLNQNKKEISNKNNKNNKIIKNLKSNKKYKKLTKRPFLNLYLNNSRLTLNKKYVQYYFRKLNQFQFKKRKYLSNIKFDKKKEALELINEKARHKIKLKLYYERKWRILKKRQKRRIKKMKSFERLKNKKTKEKMKYIVFINKLENLISKRESNLLDLTEKSLNLIEDLKINTIKIYDKFKKIQTNKLLSRIVKLRLSISKLKEKAAYVTQKINEINKYFYRNRIRRKKRRTVNIDTTSYNSYYLNDKKKINEFSLNQIPSAVVVSKLSRLGLNALNETEVTKIPLIYFGNSHIQPLIPYFVLINDDSVDLNFLLRKLIYDLHSQSRLSLLHNHLQILY